MGSGQARNGWKTTLTRSLRWAKTPLRGNARRRQREPKTASRPGSVEREKTGVLEPSTRTVDDSAPVGISTVGGASATRCSREVTRRHFTTTRPPRLSNEESTAARRTRCSSPAAARQKTCVDARTRPAMIIRYTALVPCRLAKYSSHFRPWEHRQLPRQRTACAP